MSALELKAENDGITLYAPSVSFMRANHKALGTITKFLQEELHLGNFPIRRTIKPVSEQKSRPAKKILTKEETWEKMKKENPWLAKLSDELDFEM